MPVPVLQLRRVLSLAKRRGQFLQPYALLLTCCCLIHLGGATTEIRAQSGRVKPQPQPDQTIRLRTEEVLVPISVLGDSGKLPDHLTASDLIVLEDNSRRAITALMRTPASVVLIVDNHVDVGARSQPNLNRDGALSVIDSLGEHDQAAVVTYAGKVTMLSGLTSDHRALGSVLAEKFKLASESHLYDSLVYAAELLAKAPGRHTIVLFTDGYDDFPKNALDKAKQALDRARTTVYVFDQSTMIAASLKSMISDKHPSELLSRGLDSKYRQYVADCSRYMETVQEEEKSMRALAEDSGGSFWNPPDSNEFRRDWERLISAMDTQYVISYLSEHEAGDKAPHQLNVYSTKPGLYVKARRAVYSSQ